MNNVKEKELKKVLIEKELQEFFQIRNGEKIYVNSDEDDEDLREYQREHIQLQSYYTDHDFNLPDHSNELSEATDKLNVLKLQFVNAILQQEFGKAKHTELYEEIIKVLDYVGRLSMKVFAINEELEHIYISKYKHSPVMAREVWLTHYSDLHQPYNLIKNRCFKLLDKLDLQYKDTFKENPPNWNP